MSWYLLMFIECIKKYWKCNVNKTIMILIKLFHVAFKAFFTLTSSGEVKSLYAGIKSDFL